LPRAPLRCPNPGPRRVVPGPAFPPLWRHQHVGFHLHGAEAGSAIQTWKIFLRNHVVASIDLFVVPTIAYQRLFVLLEGGLPCLGFICEGEAASAGAKDISSYGSWRTYREAVRRQFGCPPGEDVPALI